MSKSRPITGLFCLLVSLFLAAAADDSKPSKQESPEELQPSRSAAKVSTSWDDLNGAPAETKLADLLGLSIEHVVGHAGFAESDYFHEGIVEQRLRSEIGSRSANALHVVILSERGLAPVLFDVITQQPFRGGDKPPHGKLLVIADAESISRSPSVRTSAAKADAAIIINDHTAVESVFAEILRRAAAEGLSTELLMKEGGQSAVLATAETLLQTRFADSRQHLSVRLDTNYMPRDPAAESWQMGASQFLAAWKDLGPYFDGVSTEVGYHDRVAHEWRGIESETKFRTVTPTGSEAAALVRALKAGRLHPHALLGRWQRDHVRATATFDGTFLEVKVQVEASVTAIAESSGLRVNVLLPGTHILKHLELSDMERVAITPFGDIYQDVIDLSGTSVEGKQAFEVVTIIDKAPQPGKEHDRGYVRPPHSVQEQFEIIIENPEQKNVMEMIAHHWKWALARAIHSEYNRLQENVETPLAKPLANANRPLEHFESKEEALKWLLHIGAKLSDELNNQYGVFGRCPAGFLPQL